MISLVKRLRAARRLEQTWKREKIPRALRERVFREKGTTCVYCGEPDIRGLDHRKPCEKGGKSIFRNLFPCCDPCNSSKRSKSLSEWQGRKAVLGAQREA